MLAGTSDAAKVSGADEEKKLVGRSDIRSRLRRFFEVDAEMIVIAVLYALSKKGAIEAQVVEKAIRDLNLDPKKNYPRFVSNTDRLSVLIVADSRLSV